MVNKLELYKLAAKMARGCNELINQERKEAISPTEDLDGLPRDFAIISNLAKLDGFVKALVYAGIFTVEEAGMIQRIASLKKNASAALDPRVINSINSLKGFDALPPGDSG